MIVEVLICKLLWDALRMFLFKDFVEVLAMRVCQQMWATEYCGKPNRKTHLGKHLGQQLFSGE